MDKQGLNSSFVLRVRTSGGSQQLKLQNLKTGETTEFSNWKDLMAHLKARARRRGLR